MKDQQESGHWSGRSLPTSNDAFAYPASREEAPMGLSKDELSEVVPREQIETQDLEWKREWNDEYLKQLCGMANSRGGTLEIGVDDHGEVVGAKGIEHLMQSLPNKIYDVLRVTADVSRVVRDGKDIVRIMIDPKPYGVTCKGIVYMRSGGTSWVCAEASLFLEYHAGSCAPPSAPPLSPPTPRFRRGGRTPRS